VKYRHEEGDLPPDPTVFRRLVGSLNYLTITRLHIYFAIQQINQFMQSPHHLHLVALISFDISEARLVVGCYFLSILLFALLHLVMLIGMDVLILVTLLLDGACFLATP
jgi:hypothetical protein